MNRYDLSDTGNDFRSYVKSKRRPSDDDHDVVLREPTVCYLNGEPELIFCRAEGDWGPVLNALRSLRYSQVRRTLGLKAGDSCTFGFLPRNALRNDYCRVSAAATSQPREHAALAGWAAEAAAQLERYAPAAAARQRDAMQQIGEHWKLPGGLFTTGIANHDNPLPYHVDGGNIKGTWNAMLWFQNDMAGGELVLPRFRVAFLAKHPMFVIFHAQDVVHGVKAMRPLGRRAYRYTCVYYTMHGLTHCGTPAEEVARIRAVKTRRETDRVDPAKVLAKRGAKPPAKQP